MWKDWNFGSRDLKLAAQFTDPKHEYSNDEIVFYLSDFETRFVAALIEYTRRFYTFRSLLYQLFSKLYLGRAHNQTLITADCLMFNHLLKSIDFYPISGARFHLRVNFIDLVEKDNIIRTWTSIVNSWLIKRIHYNTHWAYLSTFGGAYSSLGEASREHAYNAEVISKKQLILALAFDDPNAISRCKIFLGFSYVQQGKLKEARAVLRKEYKFLRDPANEKVITDQKLIVMCIAGLKKLRLCREQLFLKTGYFDGERKRS